MITGAAQVIAAAAAAAQQHKGSSLITSSSKAQLVNCGSTTRMLMHVSFRQHQQPQLIDVRHVIQVSCVLQALFV
jgi:hypothetical protein